MQKYRKALLFTLLTIAISWTMIGLVTLTGVEFTSVFGIIALVIYMFMPTLAVFLMEKVFSKRPVMKPYLISFNFNRWWLFAWLLMPVLSFMAMGFSLFFPEVGFSMGMEGMFERFEGVMDPEKIQEMRDQMDTLPVHPFWISLVQGLIAGPTINAIAGFGEELGWRGYLLRELSRMHFWTASVVIGFIWGLWHAPLILQGHNYPEHPQEGVWMMIIWCILLTPVFMYVTIKAKSVIAAAIMHGTLNATAGIAIMLLVGGNDLINGMTGIAGFIAIAIAIAGLVIYDRLISGENIMFTRIHHHLPPREAESEAPAPLNERQA